MTAPVLRGQPSIVDLAVAVGSQIVAPAATSVDVEARFPREAFDALAVEGMLSAFVPRSQGGHGSSITDIAAVTEELARHCSSTAMVHAMHQIQVACLVRHGRSPALQELTRELVDKQLIFASATTELGIGGDVRTSTCAVERDGSQFRLTKNAPVISYGAYADAIFATARRDRDSQPNDQVLVVCRSDSLTLEPTSVWNTLGFRGTCSPGFVLTASGDADLILEEPYGDVSAHTMLPVSHILWSSVWLGMASAAVDTARRFVRNAARSRPGTTPPGAMRLAELMCLYQQFEETVHSAARRYDAIRDDPDALSSMSFAITMNTLKVGSSNVVVDIISRAMLIVGIAGYREDSDYSLGRLLRDAHGAALMVNNDRILANTAQLLLVAKD